MPDCQTEFAQYKANVFAKDNFNLHGSLRDIYVSLVHKQKHVL